MLVDMIDPGEGVLRPWLLDHSDLCVQVGGPPNLDEQVEIMARRSVFDADPETSAGTWVDQEVVSARRFRRARDTAPAVRLGRDIRELVAVWVLATHIVGHRAGLVMYRAARVHAAWRDSRRASEEDAEVVAELVLTHRRRQAIEPPPSTPA